MNKIAALLTGIALSAAIAACSGGGSAGGGITLPAPGGGNPSTGPTLPPSPTASPQGLYDSPTAIGQVVFPNGDTASGGSGQTVDGIACGATSQIYHIHAHLSLFVNGTQYAIPMAVGINNPQYSGGMAPTGSCLYSLHTHSPQGILHVEAQSQATFTLGQFFDIWGQPLSTTGAAGYNGPVTVFIGEAQYTGDPRAITLTSHELITLEVGTPLVAPPQYFFEGSL